MSDEPEVSIGEEGRKVREEFKKLKRSQKHALANTQKLATKGGPMPGGVMPLPDIYHYHLVYTTEDVTVPYFAEAFPTPRTAYLEVHRIATESEPNVEWYDDGQVMVETGLPDRPGKHRVLISVARCGATRCKHRPKTGIWLPGQREN